jgi:hypothetical protein
VGHAVAAALRLQQRHGLDIAATVIEYPTRELLLIMDNCEHPSMPPPTSSTRSSRGAHG